MEALGAYRPPSLHRLRFRRQFFLAPEFLQAFPDWNRLTVDRTHRLTVHPDLETHQAASGDKSITLLGYILDPNAPQATNADIVNALIPKLGRGRDLWKHTADFGGRWVLVVHDGEETILFHDAAGSRSIYYRTATPLGEARCASQPGLIADALGLAMDREAVEFIASRGHDDNEIYWLPGDTSLYQGIKAVLPNHYLSLRTGQTHRYWPDADVPRLSRQDALVKSRRLLRGLMMSAQRRYDMALSLTAGWDSRITLALSKDVARRLYCFTLAYPDNDKSRDVVVPALLLKQLGLQHAIIRYPERVDADFKDVYRSNVRSATAAYCADAQAVYGSYPGDRVCITGDVAEIVKCYYRLPPSDGRTVSAEDLAALCKIGDHPFLVSACAAWLSGAAPRNVHVLDLFCWEQMAGKWQALIRAQYDIVQECFAPFNCRSLLVAMLAVEEDDRRPPEHKLLRDLIESLWPEVLMVPINPPEKLRLGRALIALLTKLRIYQLIPRPMKNLAKAVLKWRRTP